MWQLQFNSMTYKCNLAILTERLNVLYESNWSRLVDAQLRKFQQNVYDVSKRNGHVIRDTEFWTFSGALLYSVTVITTIGIIILYL